MGCEGSGGSCSRATLIPKCQFAGRAGERGRSRLMKDTRDALETKNPVCAELRLLLVSPSRGTKAQTGLLDGPSQLGFALSELKFRA